MSAFGAKRKARKIQVEEEDDEVGDVTSVPPFREPTNHTKKTESPGVGNGRHFFKQSLLRQNITAVDLIQNEEDSPKGDGEPDLSGSNRPTMGRSVSMKKKPKAAASRLSFGPGGNSVEQAEDDNIITPKNVTLGRRVAENNAFKQSIPSNRVQVRDQGDEEERPKYSKDYLNELKSSTPNRPIHIDSQGSIEDEPILDASEAEGATVVKFTSSTKPTPDHIPTDSEIQEKKERRARLAHSQDFISFTEDGPPTSSSLSLHSRPKKPESRLVRDDEDFAEGFDEFVDDGRISLGKKAEKEAKRRQRKEMAEMINQAEGSGSSESDDSEAERRAAYESAQRRAGMDGLARREESNDVTTHIPAKITPLPVLGECIARFKSKLGSLEEELGERKRRQEELEHEREDICKREAEVQRLLVEAGQRFQALNVDRSVAALGSGSPGEIIERHGQMLGKLDGERGLESFGGTRNKSGEVRDEAW